MLFKISYQFHSFFKVLQKKLWEVTTQFDILYSLYIAIYMAIPHIVSSSSFLIIYVIFFKSSFIFYVGFRSRRHNFAKRYVDTSETQNYCICYQQERDIFLKCLCWGGGRQIRNLTNKKKSYTKYYSKRKIFYGWLLCTVYYLYNISLDKREVLTKW